MGAVESRTRTVAVSGYYGFGNSGDEAVLHAIVAALREEAAAAGLNLDIVVLSGNPAATERLHGVRAAHRMRPGAVLGALRRADALIQGGGSLLQDVTSARSMVYYLAVLRTAQRMRVPTYIYAQGIGPIRRRGRFGPAIARAFAACRYISVRDPGSKALLAEFGVDPARVDVVPDPVMGLSAGPGDGAPAGEALRIGVAARFWREDRRDLDAVAEGTAAVLSALSAARAVLLPFHLPADLGAADYVAERLRAAGIAPERIERRPGAEHPRDMLKETAACDVLVGMRLHALIYAAASGVPPVAVSYDPKIDAFMQSLGEAPAGGTDDLRAAALADAVMRMARLGKTEWYRGKSALIENMRQNSRRPAQLIVQGMRI